MIISGWLILALWVGFMAYWYISAIGVKKTKWRNRNGWGIGLRVIIIIAIFWLLHLQSISAAGTAIFYHTPIISGLGVAICVFGITFAIWARVYLGRNWGMPMTLKENPELVTNGPYRYVRHPIYTGFLLAMLGSALASVTLWWLISFVFFGAYFIYSAKTEERLMLEQFPEQYPTYKKRTKMLIPFVL